MTTTVILPDGETFITAAPTTTADHVHEEHAAVTHTEHDDLSVPNVLVVDYDENYDTNDPNVAQLNVVSQLEFGSLPDLLDDTRFVVHDPTGDLDVTRDHSAIRIYRDVYIQPPPNKAAGYAPPTLYTSGSIALCGDSAIGYVPYAGNGQQIPDTKYMFGRVGVLGDRSGDNDGMLMLKLTNSLHQVHIAPEPNDPNILVQSTKGANASYLKFVNVGPEVTAQDSNTVFEVKDTGHISSSQMDGINVSINSNELMIRQNGVNMEQNIDLIETLQNQMYYLTSRITALEAFTGASG